MPTSPKAEAISTSSHPPEGQTFGSTYIFLFKEVDERDGSPNPNDTESFDVLTAQPLQARCASFTEGRRQKLEVRVLQKVRLSGLFFFPRHSKRAAGIRNSSRREGSA